MRTILLFAVPLLGLSTANATDPANDSDPYGQVTANSSPAFIAANQDLLNFHFLKNGAVFRGGQPSRIGMSDLAGLEIAMIIDLQGGDIHGRNPIFNLYNYIAEPGEHRRAILREKAAANAKGIQFVSKPLNSNDPVSDSEEQTIDEILVLLHANMDHPVYIHCEHGADRTGLIMALYAVKYLGQTPEAAYQQWIDYGHKGVLDHFFTGQLDKFFWKVAPAYRKTNLESCRYRFISPS